MRLASLLVISGVAWALILAESYLFLGVIIPLGPGIHSIGSFTLSALIKIGLTFVLGIVWFGVNVYMTRLYVRSKLRNRAPSASS